MKKWRGRVKNYELSMKKQKSQITDNKIENEEALILRNQLARTLADYDNLKKRVEQDKKNFEKLANLRLVIKLLPVLDILKKAQEHSKDEGIAVTVKNFEDALAQEGIEEIKVKVGDEFNPETMEVVEVVQGIDNNNVAEVLLTGWRFTEGPVIRYARVKVFQKN